MFGYVKPYTPELLVKDHEFYRATYCGVCRAMKKYTGAFSNVALSYDSVALALVRMLFISDGEIGAGLSRCIAHPMKKRPMLKMNSALIYTARVFAILTHHKLLDDIADEGAFKKMAARAARPVFRAAQKRAAMDKISELVSTKLSEIKRLENAKTASVDLPASLFGELLGSLFAYGLSDSDATVTYEFGFHLGRFIYSADAAEDYENDRRENKYNPYVLIYGGQELTCENKKSIKTALILECKMMEGALNLFPFKKKRTIENILKNLIYDGLPKRIEFVGE